MRGRQQPDSAVWIDALPFETLNAMPSAVTNLQAVAIAANPRFSFVGLQNPKPHARPMAVNTKRDHHASGGSGHVLEPFIK